jgi:hypothetical protein
VVLPDDRGEPGAQVRRGPAGGVPEQPLTPYLIPAGRAFSGPTPAERPRRYFLLFFLDLLSFFDFFDFFAIGLSHLVGRW